ncbi:conserved hypothetical protein [Perkinsus marinus ATCC 50983]|uniref:Superoxide dismutase [Cu-Zn] n=1 Tax=Perkinsus marinus (strain ATCC 50983 / TXsc) TaxID=423536 RepID=C5KTS7_PERM5|nr:conserved hypothetical protein [Perkinsus marinus ATCC 50983]EER11969.1 conserved hypothetical protein [Perkinsus marinus ATCC 50983]|eukprot:XP_002780174.1 conserved hypothetical protein [Perkinsus marinus ATCC 50983]
MFNLVAVAILPLVAAQPSNPACQDLCLSIPGCAAAGGSYCKDYQSIPFVCHGLHFIKSRTSANATACSTSATKNCPEDYPVRCDDISPFGSLFPIFPIRASANLVARESRSPARGIFYFEQVGHARTKITYDVSNLEPGSQHGVHVHEFADFSNGCASTGGHYNPFYNTHGDRNSRVRHVGDMGNIKADRNGRARGSFYHDLIVLNGPTSSLNRAVVLHAGQDDLGQGGNAGSKTTGNSGARLACGPIALDKSVFRGN